MIRPLLGLACAGMISACTSTAPVQTITFAQSDVEATTPPGYCVDGESSQPGNGFAVLAPCRTLGANVAAPSIIGVATVQVGEAESGNILDEESDLRDFLVTEAGSALLSSEGESEDVTILSTQAFGNQVMVHFLDSGQPPFSGLQDEEWRAFTQANGRLITIAVRGLAQAPLQDGPGAGLLKLIAAGIRAAVSSEDMETASAT